MSSLLPSTPEQSPRRLAFARDGGAIAAICLDRRLRLIPLAGGKPRTAAVSGSSGALDTVPLNRVGEFEKKYIAYLRANHGDVLTSLRTEKKWTDAIQKTLDEAVAKFRAEFLA